MYINCQGNIMFDILKPNNNLALLSPFFRTRIENALKDVHQAGYDLFIFEGYRSPQRSSYLYEQGRTREGKIVTNAKAWQSLHNYAVACDLVYKIKNRWTWEGDFDKPSLIMRDHGFVWGGTWGDKPHYQLDGGLTWQECKAITDQHGLPVLWIEIENRIISGKN